MSDLLEIRRLRVSYHTMAGEIQAVRGVDLSVGENEVVAVVGESGCGKSVTARSILRLVRRPAGDIKSGSEILFRGENVLSFDKKRLRRYRGGECSIVFQDPLSALNPTMRSGRQIEENLRAHSGISAAAARAEAVELLRRVGFDDPARRARQYPHELSGGMRQRVMIAIAFSNRPSLLIADEPTTALDVTIQSRVLELLRELQVETRASIVLITHDLGVVAGIAKRIYVMYAGRIVESGSSEDIFYHTAHPYTKALLASVPRMTMQSKLPLPYIQGVPPELIDPPSGCAFAERCALCMDICRREEPKLTESNGRHSTACWFETLPGTDGGGLL
ncbi:MAG: ABC transporter ATP-binding protein [Oscillospiraceae bacterium]|jgi:oligopeptide transport system ATP-binding protein|nr:ABC transporter ATP-binding protein [Oscillospiraceae bacterium]